TARARPTPRRSAGRRADPVARRRWRTGCLPVPRRPGKAETHRDTRADARGGQGAARPAHLYHLPHRAAVLHPAFARRVPRLHPRPRMPSRRTDSQMTYNNDEHECPRPLEELAAEFDVGGMFLSPAGRWETIIDRPPFGDHPARISVYTDRTGPHYCWTFRRS